MQPEAAGSSWGPTQTWRNQLPEEEHPTTWIADRAVQHHGGLGVRKGSAVERIFREVRALRIYEGTSEIQKLVLARELVDRRDER